MWGVGLKDLGLKVRGVCVYIRGQQQEGKGRVRAGDDRGCGVAFV